MNFGLKGKNVLVTGASRGIGKSICKNLINEGCNVLAVSKTQSHLDELKKELGENLYTYCIDLTDIGSEYKVLSESGFASEGVDILINNLGDTLGIKDPLCSWNSWNKVWTVDMKSTIEFTRLIIPYMERMKWGRIVNISSLAGLENQGPVTHCTIKSAIAAYTRCMGRIYAKDGIVISCVHPGAVITEDGHWSKVMQEDPEHGKNYLKTNCPLGKFGEPDDIGTIVTMLCSQQAKFCQGTIMPVDGGQSKHFFWTRDY